MALTKVLYLPIQIKKRAFVAKLLLGYLSLKHDYCFVIGKRHSVKRVALNGPDGIFLEKDFFGKKSEYFEKFTGRDMKFYGLDDEGLVFHDDEEYINRRVDYDSLKYMERIFAWGKRHAGILQNFLGEKEAGKVVIAGNPRIDIVTGIGKYAYRKEIEDIQKRYGRFIIFNSFFALANGIRPIESQLKRLKRMKKNISEEMLQYWYDFYKHQKKLYDLIRESLLEVARDQTINLVIRPHPNEKASSWKNTFRNFKNVSITKDYDIFPWIYCADVVIHNSSSTGLESYVTGKNVIAYKPVNSEEFDLELPNSVSVVVDNVDTLKRTIYGMLNKTFQEDEKNIAKKKQIIDYHVYTGDRLSSEMILDEFNKNNFTNEVPEIKKDYSNLSLNIVLKFLYFLDKNIGLNLKNPSIINDFPPTSKDEVVHYLSCINDYFGFNFRFDVTEIASSCFLVRKI